MSIDAKALFDTIRAHIGPLSPELVKAVNGVLERGNAAPASSGGQTEAMMIRHLRREEGVIAHAYQDHLGYWTIGVGRLIDKRKGGRLTDAEINMLLANDIARFTKAMEGWPAWQRVKDNPARATALLSMCFQMGPVGLAKFKTTLALIANDDFVGASQNMLASLWAKQTPARAKRVATMMRTGAEA